MLALLVALTVIICGIGLMCYLIDVLIVEQREVKTLLRSGPAAGRCAEHGKVLPHYRCQESEAWLDKHFPRPQ